jgi:hypothetical protein
VFVVGCPKGDGAVLENRFEGRAVSCPPVGVMNVCSRICCHTVDIDKRLLLAYHINCFGS